MIPERLQQRRAAIVGHDECDDILTVVSRDVGDHRKTGVSVMNRWCDVAPKGEGGRGRMPSVGDDFTDFLIAAKRHTYAGQDDDATVAAPLLNGSRQLEYRRVPYAYRDIYFGMGFFVGQETVSKDERVIWSMCYSGGARPEIADRDLLLAIYKFLRRALLAATVDRPYRGPPVFAAGDMIYRNNIEGSIEHFHGVEVISQNGSTLYELRYSGGLLR